MLYMFYFDYTPRNVHYGRYRQEFWAVLHFPYHLCIVLAVEGLRQWTTYWSYLQAKQVMDSEFLRIPVGTPDATKAATIDIIRKYVDYLYKSEASTTILKTAHTIDSVLGSLETLPYESWTPTNTSEFDVVYRDMYRGYAEFYGIKVPKSSEADPTFLDPLSTSYDPGKDIATVYRFVFTYYFLGFGCIFFMLGAFGLFVRRKKDVWDYIAVTLRFLVGATFCAMQAMKASTNSTIYDRFVASPWPIPTVCIVMFASKSCPQSILPLSLRFAPTNPASPVLGQGHRPVRLPPHEVHHGAEHSLVSVRFFDYASCTFPSCRGRSGLTDSSSLDFLHLSLYLSRETARDFETIVWAGAGRMN